MYGIDAQRLETSLTNSIDMKYRLSIRLSDFGITQDEDVEELKRRVPDAFVLIDYVFKPEKPRKNQPGSNLAWDTEEFRDYRVVMKRKNRDLDLQNTMLNMIFRTRYEVLKFAKEKKTKPLYYTLNDVDEHNKEWDFEELLLCFIDMYRSFASDISSKRARLYGSLQWMNRNVRNSPIIEDVPDAD